MLTFRNAAVDHGFTTAPDGYAAAWHAFDNATGESRPVGRTTGTQPQLQAPSRLPSAVGAYIRIDLAADHPDHPSWKEPARAYFLRQANGWKLVGFERLPDSRAP